MKYRITDYHVDGNVSMVEVFWDLDVLEHISRSLQDPMINKTEVEKIPHA